MDWTNDNIIEFIELLQTEPSIWNHKAKSHRNRNLVVEAWNRIQNNFSLSCTIEELKRKRNSLLTQYRDNKRKIKESQQKNEIYKPSWFAFDVLNSYLGHLYESPVSMKSEELILSYDEDPLSNDSDTYNEAHNSHIEIDTSLNSNKRSLQRESSPRISHGRRFSHESTTPSEQDSYNISKKRRVIKDPRINTAERDPTFFTNNKEDTDRVRECELYGQLLSEKLKPLEQDERLQLMNEIDNLVFNYLMKIRKRGSSRNNQTVYQVLPGPSCSRIGNFT